MKAIGIDPAFRKSGFGVALLDDGVAHPIHIKTFIDFFEWVRTFDFSEVAYIAIENSNLQNTTFRADRFHGRISRDAGKNMAVSQMVCDYLRFHLPQVTIIELSPKEKGAKINQVMMEKVMSGYWIVPRKTSQDFRDALMLIYKAQTKYFFRNNRKN
jgi:hypothetical protein